MKKWFGKEVKIALSVLASILILYVGINYLKGINVMKPSNYYYVQSRMLQVWPSLHRYLSMDTKWDSCRKLFMIMMQMARLRCC